MSSATLSNMERCFSHLVELRDLGTQLCRLTTELTKRLSSTPEPSFAQVNRLLSLLPSWSGKSPIPQSIYYHHWATRITTIAVDGANAVSQPLMARLQDDTLVQSLYAAFSGAAPEAFEHLNNGLSLFAFADLVLDHLPVSDNASDVQFDVLKRRVESYYLSSRLIPIFVQQNDMKTLADLDSGATRFGHGVAEEEISPLVETSHTDLDAVKKETEDLLCRSKEMIGHCRQTLEFLSTI